MKAQIYALRFYVICFFLFSVPAFFYPNWFAMQLGFELDRHAALMEFVAAYGGLILGVGLYLLYCLRNNTEAGLVCILLVVGSLFLGRVIGYAIAPEINAIQASFLFIELLTICLISGLLYYGRNQSAGYAVQ